LGGILTPGTWDDWAAIFSPSFLLF
jgi:hypothetical protein